MADESDALGALRSTHEPFGLGWQQLVPSVLIAAIILASNVALVRPLFLAALVSIPVAVLPFLILAGGEFRMRGVRVTLHVDGIVVERRGAREVVLFDDIDEVWYELESVRASSFTFARFRALRLVDHAGKVHTIPVQLRDGLAIVCRVLRRCSTALLPEARRRFRAGERLTFGNVGIDRDGITIGRSSVAWQKVRLVRLLSGSVALFRWMPVVPWRTIRLDRMPHPLVFCTLLAEHAPRVVKDEALAGLLRDE